MAKTSEKVEVENINTPGRVERVDKAKYEAMKKALLKVIPSDTPGLTFKDLKAALLKDLPDDLFPGGATSGWWLKTVQLDLEAKKIIARADVKPLHFFKL